jgi:hypothetical protein
MQALSNQPLGEKRRFEKNYQLGLQKSVNVGESIVRLQDYWLELSESAVVVPSARVNLKGGPIDVTLEAGEKYPIRGSITIGDEQFFIVGLAKQNGVLVRPDGKLHNRMVAETSPSQYVQIIYTMTISNPSVKLHRENIEKIKTTNGYENYEILYTGKSSSGMNLTYREFSPEGVARVAFFQNLVYEADAKIISFKKFRIAIDKATSNEIVFTVLDDGYK